MTRRLALALLVLVALALGVETVRRTVAHRYAASDPTLALAWSPNDVEAGEEQANRLAGEALRDRRPEAIRAAIAASTRLLEEAPLRAAALRNLGLLAPSHGGPERADAVLTLAGERGWRDPGAQLALLQRDLARQDLAAALPRFDAIMRMNPDMKDRLFPALAALASTPEGPSALAGRLASRPPWREAFLTYAARQGPSMRQAADLFQRLAAMRSPASDKAEGALLDRMAAEGEASAARALWLSRVPHGLARGWPYDGDFVGLPGPTPFNWAFRQRMGEALRLQRADDGRTVLSVDVPSDGPKTLAEQLLMLRPGPWLLSAEVMNRAPAPGAAVAFMIACTKGEPPIATLRADASVSRPWVRVSQVVSIPATCPAQWLVLASLPGDGFSPILADITHITLTPISDSAS